MGFRSNLPHRRVAPAQSIHQLRREPMSAVGEERGSWEADLSLSEDKSGLSLDKSPVFLLMYSAYKLNNQGDNIQP